MKYPETTTAKDIKIGTIVHDVFDEGLRFIIMRGPYHWCGYVGIPEDHPLAGLSYNDINFVSAHGGLTFASEARDFWPKGYYWYGWDYGHAGDKSYFDIPNYYREGKDWTIEEVIKDSWDALYDFKQLMKLAEKIKNKNP